MGAGNSRWAGHLKSTTAKSIHIDTTTNQVEKLEKSITRMNNGNAADPCGIV